MNRSTFLAAASALAAGLALIAATGVASASGGSGGGGGGTGGGGSASCAGPTSVVVANTIDGTQVAPYWQANSWYGALASGSASKACDNLPVIVRFTDTVLTGDPTCAARVPDYRNPMYFKYGNKPPSRYESAFSFATSTDCVGELHSIRADMINTSTGAVLGSTSATWTPA